MRSRPCSTAPWAISWAPAPTIAWESRAHYERCIAIARSIRQPRELADCLWSLAGDLARDGQNAEARRRIDEALALVRETGHVWSLAHASRQRMRVSWSTRPREAAIAEAIESLDTIEAVRRLQEEEGGAAEVFSGWTADYHWLSGRLLEGDNGRRSRSDLERAFEVAERMRARALLDALGAAKASPELPRDHPQVLKRRELLQRIVDIHRDLLAPATTAESRRALVARLDALELEEQEVRRALRSASPQAAAYSAPHFARLDEVEARLDPHEALLSFQVGLVEDILGQKAGGAWLLVSTRGGHRGPPHPRPGPLAGRGAGVSRTLRAARWPGGRPRIRCSSASCWPPPWPLLPREVDRFVIVPDDLLHLVPFAALRPAVGSRTAGRPLRDRPWPLRPPYGCVGASRRGPPCRAPPS